MASLNSLRKNYALIELHKLYIKKTEASGSIEIKTESDSLHEESLVFQKHLVDLERSLLTLPEQSQFRDCINYTKDDEEGENVTYIG